MDNTNKELQIIYGDVTLGIKGTDFQYIFSYQTGGPESFYAKGKEWLYRTPKPTFWRATTDNDRGSGFSQQSSMWLGADMFPSCKEIAVSIDGKSIDVPIAPLNNQYHAKEYAENVQIMYRYELMTVPKTTVDTTYTIDATGKIHVQMVYSGKAGLPELPVFGLRLILPTPAAYFRYDGLSGETYPDRMRGGQSGIHTVNGLPVTPYLVPQECGMHMQTNWVEVYRQTVLDNRHTVVPKETYLKIESGRHPFAFSCLPYTAEELENATHQEELPTVRRTVLCINGAVRGVGGIDSWGSDVEAAYHIDATEDIEYDFSISF